VKQVPHKRHTTSFESILTAEWTSYQASFWCSAGARALSVVAATNRPNEIEPALRRPGRLDREIQFTVPSSQVACLRGFGLETLSLCCAGPTDYFGSVWG